MTNALSKIELLRNPATLAANGDPWRAIDDVDGFMHQRDLSKTLDVMIAKTNDASIEFVQALWLDLLQGCRTTAMELKKS